MAPLVLAIVAATTGLYAAVEGQDQARRAKNAAGDVKKATDKRTDELAAEAAAKEAAKKKAETSGQRIGFGDGGGSRSVFTGGGASGGTGFTNKAPSEDNVGRSTLFGN